MSFAWLSQVCLGTAPVAAPGMSLHELGEVLAPGYVFRDSIHQAPDSQQQAVSSQQPRLAHGLPARAELTGPLWVQARPSAQARQALASVRSAAS